MNYLISYIVDHPEYLPDVAEFLKINWGHRFPERSLQEWETKISQNKNKIPCTIIAINTEHNSPRILGTASLQYCGMSEYRKDSVWLTKVYVHPAHRNNGIASALIKELVEIARHLKVHDILLCTQLDDLLDKKLGLYKKFGWKEINRTVYQGIDVIVMENVLNESTKII